MNNSDLHAFESWSPRYQIAYFQGLHLEEKEKNAI